MNKEAISKILQEEFMSVYCNTCAERETGEACIDCHRKSMRWSLSEKAAEVIADKIIAEIVKE